MINVREILNITIAILYVNDARFNRLALRLQVEQVEHLI